MEELPGVEISVFVDGQALPEYCDHARNEQEHTQTRYIEAVSGKEFQIHITVPEGFEHIGDCLIFEIYVDGKWTASPVSRKSMCGNGKDVRISEGQQWTRKTVRK